MASNAEITALLPEIKKIAVRLAGSAKSVDKSELREELYQIGCLTVCEVAKKGKSRDFKAHALSTADAEMRRAREERIKPAVRRLREDEEADRAWVPCTLSEWLRDTGLAQEERWSGK